jgi:hypothetical protein
VAVVLHQIHLPRHPFNSKKSHVRVLLGVLGETIIRMLGRTNKIRQQYARERPNRDIQAGKYYPPLTRLNNLMT